jgi:glycerol kinase
MGGAFLAIDQGTAATKAHLLRDDGAFETVATIPHRSIMPQPGRVEHDPEELLAAIRQCLERADPVAAVGLANQGATCLAWDGATGRPLHNAITWQDARTHDVVERLKARGAEALNRERSGLPLDPYFAASKLRWLFDNTAEALDLMRRGRLRLGTTDAFFLDRLTGRFVTDPTTASRTGLLNIDTLTWDSELCSLFGVPMAALPQIMPTTAALAFGHVKTGAGAVPVTASVANQQAALYGHGCRLEGDTEVTFGTGASALALAGARPRRDTAGGLLPTVAWRLGTGAAAYALDGAVYSAGAAVDWARGIGLFDAYDQLRFEAAPAIERGLAFVPALSGLACPYWDRSAAGLWLGLGLDTTRADMAQALLEGIALRVADLLDAIGTLVPLTDTVSIDGGLARNDYFCRFLADATGRAIAVPSAADLTGLGTALLARIGTGQPDDLPPPPPERTISPARRLDPALRARFRDAVERSRGWRTA